uniref:Uncharacterized protein n=1 Tax=Panagrolaimus sp. JU765 TaxID=591449 RepID=A0AC34RAG6_9BILA
MKEYRLFIALYTSWDGLFAFCVGILMQPRLYFPSTGCIIQGIGRDVYLWLGPGFGEFLAKMTFHPT